MNIDLLLALGLALAVGALAVVLLLRRRPRQGARSGAAPAPQAPLARRAPVPPPAQPAQPAPTPPTRADLGAAQLQAQRQAATEALRLARQRKAEEAALQEAARAAQAQADAVQHARPAPPAPPSVARAAAPAAAAASAATSPPGPLLSPLAISTSTSTTTSPTTSPAAAPLAAGLAPLRQMQPPHVQPPHVQRPHVPLVLLADDSKVVRVKTGRLLEKQGWRVLLADDGEAALLCLDRETPDLLITDVEMPGIDGFELTRRVRAHPRLGRLPVIMITSSDERHRAEANAAGVNLLLGKPYAEETLLAQVQVMLAAAARRAGLALH